MDTMTVSQVAKRLGLSAGSIRNLPEAELPVMRTHGNQRRYKKNDVEVYAAAYEAPSYMPVTVETYPENDIAEFAAFIAEKYAENEELSVAETEALFKATGVAYLFKELYGVWHTQGPLYVLGDIYDFFDRHGVVHKYDALKCVEFGEPDETFKGGY